MLFFRCTTSLLCFPLMQGTEISIMPMLLRLSNHLAHARAWFFVEDLPLILACDKRCELQSKHTQLKMKILKPRAQITAEVLNTSS